MTYYVLGADNKQYGPVDSQTLEIWLRQGLVMGSSSSRADGESTWTPLRSRKEFKALLDAGFAKGGIARAGDAPSHPSSLSQAAKATAMTNNFALAGGALALFALVPGSTSVMLCVLELVLCHRIGKLYLGKEYSMAEEITAYVWTFLAAFAGQLIASILLELLNIVPVLGWAIKGGVAAGIIKALGSMLTEHYEKTTK